MTWGKMICRVVSDDYKDTLVEQFPDEFTQRVECRGTVYNKFNKDDDNEKSIFKDLILKSSIYFLEVIASNGQIVKRYQVVPEKVFKYIKSQEYDESSDYLWKMKKKDSPKYMINGNLKTITSKGTKEVPQEGKKVLTLSDRARDPRLLKPSIADMVIHLVLLYVPSDVNDENIRTIVDRFIGYYNPADKTLFNKEEIDSIVSKIKDRLTPVLRLRHEEKYFAPEIITADKAVDNYTKPSDKLLEDVKEDKDCICKLLKTDIYALQHSDICELRELIKVTTIMPDDKLPNTLEELETIRQTYTCRHCGKVYTKEEVSKLLYEEEELIWMGKTKKFFEGKMKEISTAKCFCESMPEKKSAFLHSLASADVTTREMIDNLKSKYKIGHDFTNLRYTCKCCGKEYGEYEIGWLFDI